MKPHKDPLLAKSIYQTLWEDIVLLLTIIEIKYEKEW